MSAGRACSNQTTRYDYARVERLSTVDAAIKKLRLPLLQSRKVGVILSALEVQIEDGGDHPDVNRLLLGALRAGILHQVEERQARAVLRAIDTFEQTEAERWEQVETGTLPAIEVPLPDQVGDLMQAGHDLLKNGQGAAACDCWLEAWELIKQLAKPTLRTTFAFNRVYPTGLHLVFNWCQVLAGELDSAGHQAPVYHEHRVRYAREFLGQFPDEDDLLTLNFMAAEAEALWRLDRRAEAEVVYERLVVRFPDDAWAYIHWADNYWLFATPPRDYARGEAILKRGLPRPRLSHREDLLDRLEDLYTEWGKPDEQAAIVAQREQLATGRRRPPRRPAVPPPPPPPARGVPPAAPTGTAPPARKPARNEPCWCNSGRKYKRCHLDADEAARRG